MDETPRPRGAVALDQWCAADRGRAARLALVLDVQESTVSRWRAGTSTPGGPARLALPRLTSGAVPLGGWDADDLAAANAQPAPADVADAPTVAA